MARALLNGSKKGGGKLRDCCLQATSFSWLDKAVLEESNRREERKYASRWAYGIKGDRNPSPGLQSHIHTRGLLMPHASACFLACICYLIHLCVCLLGCMCTIYILHTDTHTHTCRGQKRVIDPSEMVLQVVVNYLTWVLGTNLGSLKEQGLVTTESSIQSTFKLFFF